MREFKAEGLVKQDLVEKDKMRRKGQNVYILGKTRGRGAKSTVGAGTGEAEVPAENELRTLHCCYLDNSPTFCQ